MSRPEPRRWALVPAMRSGIASLFPTRSSKLAVGGLVGLAVLITYMELMAAQLFASLVTDIETQSATESGIFLVGFLLAFAAIKGVGYFQSVYRLTVFEKSFRKVEAEAGRGDAWRWPMAIALVGMLGQVGRLLIVTVTVAAIAWVFGILLLLCSAVAVAIVSRTGRRQYAVHHAFVEAKRAGNPPSASERIGTRVRAGERAGLGAILPVLVFVAALGIGAVAGRVTAESALVLFIAARMAANMYGTLATTTMRYIRSEVMVETSTRPPVDSSRRLSAVDAHEEETALDALAAEGYLAEPPAQVAARLIDEGRYVGDVEALGRRAREGGYGPRAGTRKLAQTSRPDKVTVLKPNQAWRHQACRLPVVDRGTAVYLQVAVDLFSRAVVSWRLDASITDDAVEAFFLEACRRQEVRPEDVELFASRDVLDRVPNVHDLLSSLGVVRTLAWEGPASGGDARSPARPALPTTFRTSAEAQAWVDTFVAWYNDVFYQPDVGYLHPSDVHGGLADMITTARKAALDAVTGNGTTPGQGGFPVAWLPPAEVSVQRLSVVPAGKPTAASEERMLDEDEDL